MEIILNKDNDDILGVVKIGNTTNYFPLIQPADFNWFFKTASDMGYEMKDINCRWMTEDEINDLYAV